MGALLLTACQTDRDDNPRLDEGTGAHHTEYACLCRQHI